LVGFTIGPVIAFVALAATGNDYRAPAFIAALFSLASILLTVFWFEETLPAEKRGQNSKRPSLSPGAMVDAIKHPTVGLLLILIFLQHLAFGGFEQLLALFTLSRLGLNGSGNAAVFFYVGVVLVAVQGGFIGKWSRRYGDRRLVFGGLALLAVGLTAVGLTPRQPVPWYSEEAILSEMSSTDTNSETVNVNDVPIELPDEANKSWLGLLWMLLAMTPIAIGGGLLQPTLNSLITKRTDPLDVGGMLGVSAAFLSAANFFGPIIGGAIFQSAGATALFLGWGLLMAVLLVIALRYLKPGQEENSPTGLARGGAH
jgi:DHA1 family tetracycline resistance protein-like MFS transporter